MTRFTAKFRWLLPALVGAVATVGCTDSGTSSTATQEVTGTISTSADTVAVRAVSGTTVVAAAELASDGSFTLQLPVGEYRLEALGSSGVTEIAAQDGATVTALTLKVCKPGAPAGMGPIGPRGGSGDGSGSSDGSGSGSSDGSGSGSGMSGPHPGPDGSGSGSGSCTGSGMGSGSGSGSGSSMGSGACAADPASCGCAADGTHCWPAPVPPTCPSGQTCVPPTAITADGPPTSFGCKD